MEYVERLLRVLVKANAVIDNSRNMLTIAGVTFGFNEEQFPLVLKSLGLRVDGEKLADILKRKLEGLGLRVTDVDVVGSDVTVKHVTERDGRKTTIELSTSASTYPMVTMFVEYDTDVLVYTDRVETTVDNVADVIRTLNKTVEEYKKIEPRLREIKKFAERYGYTYSKPLGGRPQAVISKANVNVVITPTEEGYTGFVKVNVRKPESGVKRKEIVEILDSDAEVNVRRRYITITVPFSASNLDEIQKLIDDTQKKLEEALGIKKDTLQTVALKASFRKDRDLLTLFLLRAAGVPYIILHVPRKIQETFYDRLDKLVERILPPGAYGALKSKYQDPVALFDNGKYDVLATLIKHNIIRTHGGEVYVLGKPLTDILSDMTKAATFNEIKAIVDKVARTVKKAERKMSSKAENLLS